MKTTNFSYDLPKNLIANSPAEPRDSSRLFVVDRHTGLLSHHIFYQLPDILNNNDVLVFNQSKVFPARLIGKKDTGGKIEILLLEKQSKSDWKAIYKGKIKIGMILNFGKLQAQVNSINDNLTTLSFNLKEDGFWQALEKEGFTPLPPYIRPSEGQDKIKKNYQTVYAKEIGSAAAPTAGFHFTKVLINKLKKRNIQTEFVTLHVGLGTFAPVKEKELEEHKMHKEYYTLNNDVANRLNQAKKQGKRIVAVGTTAARVLETRTDRSGKLKGGEGYTDIFIYPPYKFRFINTLITNFHLPHSTLLALVSAFVSYPNTKYRFKDFRSTIIGRAYNLAIEKKYRFYSFGDAMLIV